MHHFGLPLFLAGLAVTAAMGEPVYSAEPGMARVYMIQGDLLRGPVPVGPGTEGQPDYYVNGKVWDGKTTIYANGAMVIGAAAAALISAAAGEPEAPPTQLTRLRPLGPPSLFYLDHKRAAEPKQGEYAVADIRPGSYELKLCFALRDCVVQPLEVVEGQDVYLVANADVPNGPVLEVCHQDCGDRIRDGHEIAAFPKPGSNIPGF